jgi:hypothetical protein
MHLNWRSTTIESYTPKRFLSHQHKIRVFRQYGDSNCTTFNTRLRVLWTFEKYSRMRFYSYLYEESTRTRMDFAPRRTILGSFSQKSQKYIKKSKEIKSVVYRLATMAHSRTLLSARPNMHCTNVSVVRSPMMDATKQKSLPIQCGNRRRNFYDTACSSPGGSTKAEYDLKTWLMYNRIVQARMRSNNRGEGNGVSRNHDENCDGSEILASLQDSREASESKIYDGEIFELEM